MLVAAAKWLAGRLLRLLPERAVGRILPPKFRFDPADTPAPPVPPDSKIRLFIAPVNYAGQGWQWARAVERFVPGAGAVSMVVRMSGDFRHPADNVVPLGFYAASRRWQSAQRRAVTAGFTHVMIEAAKQPFGAVLDESVESQARALDRAGVGVLMLCHGSDIRLPSRHRERITESPFHDTLATVSLSLERVASTNRVLLDRLGFPVFVSTPDLLVDVPYATWLPVVVDVHLWDSGSEPMGRARPVVVHAPSSASVKGSEVIDPVMQRLDDAGVIEYRRIEKVPFERMPGVYRDADIVLDQFRLGDYGVAACEAMAAGRVVVGHVSEDARSRVAEATGLELPIVEATVHTLEGVVRGLIADRSRTRELGARSRLFAQTVHDGRVSARVLGAALH